MSGRRKLEREAKTPPAPSRRGAQPALRSSSATLRSLSHAHAGNRDSTVRLLQQTQGNAYVQRLLHAPAATLQRQTGTARASRTVPGLPHDVVRRLEQGLSDNRQGMLDTLTAALVARGDVDLSFLVGDTMNYVDDKSGMAPGHFGHTSLSPGSGRPRPCRVDIGPDAFRSVSDLYATVRHEWLHVLQFRRPETASEAADEMEARLWEVENMELTGLSRSMDYLTTLRSQLVVWWSRLTAVEQAAFNDRYDAAQQTIRDALIRRPAGRTR